MSVDIPLKYQDSSCHHPHTFCILCFHHMWFPLYCDTNHSVVNSKVNASNQAKKKKYSYISQYQSCANSSLSSKTNLLLMMKKGSYEDGDVDWDLFSKNVFSCSHWMQYHPTCLRRARSSYLCIRPKPSTQMCSKDDLQPKIIKVRKKRALFNNLHHQLLQ